MINVFIPAVACSPILSKKQMGRKKMRMMMKNTLPHPRSLGLPRLR
jgi:hypothetical protein